MKILFIGQLGIPQNQPEAINGPEWRAYNLAAEMEKRGHEVTLIGTKGYLPKHIKRFNGLNLKYRPSFDPRAAGGKVYGWLSLIEAVMGKYDVIQIQNWQLASGLRWLARIKPNCSIVWTVDSWPRRANRRTGEALRLPRVTVTVPTRELQSRLLNELGVKAHYVPDGYDRPAIKAVPAAHFGLRTGQYVLTTETDPKELRNILKAYRLSGSRKKLVAAVERKGPYKRLESDFSSFKAVGEQQGRSWQSLINQAHLVILAGRRVKAETVLWVMEAGLSVVATIEPLFEELLGITARFAAPGDIEDTAAAIKSVVNNPKKQSYWGAKARRRARQHFSWERIVEDYRILYAGETRMIRLDSASKGVLKAKEA